MRRLLNSPWAVLVLCVLATYFVVQSFFSGGAGPHRTTSSAASDEPAWIEEEIEAEPGKPVSVEEALAQLGIPSNAPDPFGVSRADPVASVVTTTTETTETVHLSAIWQQGEATFLVVNNRIRQVGDTIGQITIDSATMEGAWLSHRKGREFLPFGEVFSLVTSTDDKSTINPSDDEL